MPDNPVSDSLWVLLAAVLVILMQVGFLCLETGFVRAKNGINVAIKNVSDFCVATLVFWAFGFALMFGATHDGLIGTSGFLFDGSETSLGGALPAHWLIFFFLFQVAFCSTATTIVSGAVAERMTFPGYLAVSAVLAAIVYPVFGHWAWGGLAFGQADGWLSSMGFIDFAGSTVVHSIGGWMALAAILMVGARHGRFEQGAGAIEGHNLPLAAMGVFLLWIGWFGFNGGSTLAFNDSVAGIIVNTLLAGCTGGLGGIAISWWRSRRPDTAAFLNGILAGLVGITACCHVVSFAGALFVGASSALICYLAGELLERLKIDDAVGAVPVHLAAGIWGTRCVALVGKPELWGTGHDFATQLGVQALGIAVAGVFAFTLSIVALSVISRFVRLRVTEREERIGLNVSEHGASSAVLDLLVAMEVQSRRGDFSKPAPVEPFTEAGEIAVRYNNVLARFNAEVNAREATARDLLAAKERAELADAAKGQFLAQMSHELRTPLNAIIGFSEVMNGELLGPIENAKYKEYLGDIHKSGTYLLNLINDILDLSKIQADKYELNESEIALGSLLEDCQRLIAPRAENEGVELRLDCQLAGLCLYADERAVRQMLLNLLSNAVKFTPRGGQVCLRALVEPDGRIAVAVSDTGVGMKKADIPKALSPFGQINNDKTVYVADGTGLGLPITRALVELHGGTLVIDSVWSEGTTITLRFPEWRLRTAIAVNSSAA
ncbi:MAG: ammonium transporter [Alphaproteobacteria bacterium]|nr:ammonium transporter [Alphaproteobacteria bacterium]